METNFIDRAIIEIYKFVPIQLLPQNPLELDIEEFLGLYAKAKYVIKLEEYVIAKAISEVFGD